MTEDLKGPVADATLEDNRVCPTCKRPITWLDIISCSTLDDRTVELLLPDGRAVKGYFSSSRRRWRMQSGPIIQEWPSPFKNPVTGERPVRTHHMTVEQDFPANVYPTHWRPLQGHAVAGSPLSPKAEGDTE